MRRVFEGLIRDRIVLSAIAANTLVIFARGFHGIPATTDCVLMALDATLTTFFVVEIVTKIRLWGWREFWSGPLNRLDLVVVAISLPEIVAPWTGGSSYAVLLAIRAARLLRLLRLFRFIPNGSQLWEGIRRALRASIGVAAVLALYNLLLALWACQLFGDVAPQHFGDPAVSLYSIFRVFTVEGWYEIPNAIAATGSATQAAIARPFFLFAVLTGGVLGLSLANAVFVDEMVIDNNAELERQVAALTEEIRGLREELRVSS